MNYIKYFKIECIEVLIYMGKIYIIGEDERQTNLKKMYSERLVSNLVEADCVIMPTPLTKDGINITGAGKIDTVVPLIKHKVVIAGRIPEAVGKKFDANNITYYDLMEQEDLAVKNAVPTAEGVIFKILQEQKTTIFNSNVLVLGFGKCGKALADRLYGLKANLFCEARRKKDIAQIESLGYNSVDIAKLEQVLPNMDIVINTVPYMLLNKRRLELLKKDALVIDIASAPGGTDFEYCKEKGIRAYLELGIPARTSPVSAARFTKEVIDSILGDRT